MIVLIVFVWFSRVHSALERPEARGHSLGHSIAIAYMSMIISTAVQQFRALFVADIRAVQSCSASGRSAIGIVVVIFVLQYARGVRVQRFKEIRGLKFSSREVLFS